MKLFDILKSVNYQTAGNVDLKSIDIQTVQFDSRLVERGSMFIAIVGTLTDGHNYIEAACEKGASAIICQTLPEHRHENVAYIVTPDSNEALGIIASNLYGNPSSKLKLIGITGTNGKTTTVTLLHKLFRMHGHNVGLLSTIINKINEREIPSTHTTPDALQLNKLLAEMVEENCQYAFMEVSSHALSQQRVSGITFAGAIFSNITHDHLDYHKTMSGYIAAKKRFFDNLPKTAFALTNRDDRNGMVMVQNCKGDIKTYSLNSMADFRCKIVENSFEGLHLEINKTEIWTRLVGKFNAYNLTAIYATACLCGMEPTEALELISQLTAAEGRFEYVQGNGITAIVDYAHTPDALQNVIDTINNIRNNTQQLITVVGCGGDRDPMKRPVMAQIAVTGSSKVILTSDNPRTEDPDKILDNMEAGINENDRFRVVRISDRRQAIRTACMMAQSGDIILVAGKGHEKYQEINGVRNHFDDKEELSNILK